MQYIWVAVMIKRFNDAALNYLYMNVIRWFDDSIMIH